MYIAVCICHNNTVISLPNIALVILKQVNILPNGYTNTKMVLLHTGLKTMATPDVHRQLIWTGYLVVSLYSLSR